MAKNILALETSTEACSVALLDREGEMIERYQVAPRQHSQLLIPMIDSVLAEASINRHQIELIAFGRGPGAFTGLRIAAGMAQGLAYALNVPVAPVSTLAATALPYAKRNPAAAIVVANDARMAEVYTASYCIGEGGQLQCISDEKVCAPEKLTTPAGHWLGVGSGWLEYQDQMAVDWEAPLSSPISAALPHAGAVAELAKSVTPVAPEKALPIYLRDKVTYG